MVNENPNIEQNITTPSVGDREKEKRLLEALKAIPDEEIIRLWEEFDEEERRREEEEIKNWEVPQELKDYRAAWKEKIGLDEEKKQRIIDASEKIPVNVIIDADWSRLIEFKLWNKRYKILEPKLEMYTDDKYRYHHNYDSITHIDRDVVKLQWMWWDNIWKWKNQALKKYVKDNQKKWLHIAKIEEIKQMLQELWKEANLNNKKDEIAMLMYLTGLDWFYWLSMWDYKRSWGNKSRSALECCINSRSLCYTNHSNSRASILMLACK